MNLQKLTLSLLALALASGPVGALAQSVDRNVVPYVGNLQQNGQPVTGRFAMAFSLYDSASATTPLETISMQVDVAAGNFSVAVGPLATATLAVSELYIGVSVNSIPLQGRQRIYAVPFALRAQGTPAFVVDGAISVQGSSVTLRDAANGAGGIALQHAASNVLVVNPGGTGFASTHIDGYLIAARLTAETVDATQDVTVGGDATVTGDLTVNGSTRLGLIHRSCTPNSPTYTCRCAAGESVVSGGTSVAAGSNFIRTSQPSGVDGWQVSCQTCVSGATGGTLVCVLAICGAVEILCARIH